mmetsp:Transcript_16913/g.30325  ORF Transcript_16913/g.30325 Transcript_16913/m.30325 type:complete len:158 (+) Transcript_16913:255-728(+)
MSPLDRARSLLLRFQKVSVEKSTYNRAIYSYMSCEDAQCLDSSTMVRFRMSVEPHMIDCLTQSLHTGAIAAVVDGCTSLCMMLADPDSRSPVSINLNISNFTAPKLNSLVDIETRCWHSELNLGQTTARLTSGGVLVASASHRHMLFSTHPLLAKVI